MLPDNASWPHGGVLGERRDAAPTLRFRPSAVLVLRALGSMGHCLLSVVFYLLLRRDSSEYANRDAIMEANAADAQGAAQGSTTPILHGIAEPLG